jgi:hypothetical protein
VSADSASVSISVSQAASNGKPGKGKPSDEETNAFEISLDVAREESDGDTSTTNITIQRSTNDTEAGGADQADGEVKIEIEISGDGVAEALGVTGSVNGETLNDVKIEIESVVFSGDDLQKNLTASTVLGGGSVALTGDGSFGVSGSISGDAEVRLEVGETLTFTLPKTESEVVGGQVTISNLFNDGQSKEGALVFAYDADDHLLASYFALGNETGEVTIDIDVAFARLDFKAADNDAFLFQDNSNFGVSEVSAIFASVVEGIADGASQLIDDVISNAGDLLSKLVDLRHFGTVDFELTRITADQMATIEGIRRASVDLDGDTEREREIDVERVAVYEPDDAEIARFWHVGDRLAG